MIMSKPNFEELIAQLDSDEPTLRPRARNALLEAGNQATPQLIDALGHEQEGGSEPRGSRSPHREWGGEVVLAPNVPADAALLLGEIGDRRAVQPLIVKLRELLEAAVGQQLEESWLNSQVRWACVRALRTLGDEAALPAFVEVLGSGHEGDELMRADAASAIGEMRASGAIPVLLDRLVNDPSALVRKSVAEALGELERQELAPRLLQALMNDEDEGVRAAAGESLARLT